MDKKKGRWRDWALRVEFWILMAGSIVAIVASFMGWW